MPNPTFDIELSELNIDKQSNESDNILAIRDALTKIQIILNNVEQRLKALE